MDTLDSSIRTGEKSLLILDEQSNKIDNIHTVSKNVHFNLTYSQTILNSMTSFFYRMKLKYWDDHCDSYDNNDTNYTKKNNNITNTSKSSNITVHKLNCIQNINKKINNELTHQNDQLKDIITINDINKGKLNTCLIST